MAESFDIWKLHLVYRLSRIPPGFDEDVLGKVRAIEGVTSVTVVLSNNTTTHRAFSTRYAHAVVAAVVAKNASKRLSTPITPRCGCGSVKCGS